MFRLKVTANIVPSLPVLVTLMIDVLRSSEMPVLTRVPRRYIADDAVLLVTAVKTSDLMQLV
jgi:hypothetical protein